MNGWLWFPQLLQGLCFYRTKSNQTLKHVLISLVRAARGDQCFKKRTFLDQGHSDGATTTKAIPEQDLPTLSLPRKNSRAILNINLYFKCFKISKPPFPCKIREILEKTEHKLYLHTSPTERQPRASIRSLESKDSHIF